MRHKTPKQRRISSGTNFRRAARDVVKLPGVPLAKNRGPARPAAFCILDGTGRREQAVESHADTFYCWHSCIRSRDGRGECWRCRKTGSRDAEGRLSRLGSVIKSLMPPDKHLGVGVTTRGRNVSRIHGKSVSRAVKGV